MKYNIISINDDRLVYKDHIRRVVDMDEVHIPSVNARELNIKDELAKREIFITYPGMFSVGEIGIWLSMIDCWQWAVDNDEPILVFEDDACPAEDFSAQLRGLMKELPREDYDFLTLWVPDNQRQDYNYNVYYDSEGNPHGLVPPRLPDNRSVYNFGAEKLSYAYQGYGNVAGIFSPKGSKYFLEKVKEVGIYTPVDCYLFQEAHGGRCAGYAPKPNNATIVGYDWKAETTIHGTEKYGE